MRKRAFSLVEILIVIALIVLMIGLALPAFNFISGGKSIDGATNQISAFLARARTEAVGLQEMRGVMFYIDPATERQMMVLVKEVTAPATANANVDVWLDVIDSDHLPLPKGVGIQLLNDAKYNSPQAPHDRYVGFNSIAGSPVLANRVILFDGYGKLSSSAFGLNLQSATGTPTPMCKLLFGAATSAHLDYPTGLANIDQIPASSFGFVLFDHGTFTDKGFADTDQLPPTVDTAEETWLDENATAILINRYNGTLVKGQ